LLVKVGLLTFSLFCVWTAAWFWCVLP